MLRAISITGVVLACVLAAENGAADTFTVNCGDPNEPNNYTTIQAALNAAQGGDTVVVYPGTYRESLVFPDREITLTSTDPTDPAIVAGTVIDGDVDENPNTPEGSVVTFASGDAERLLTGFTITGGYTPGWPGPQSGGGINENDSQDVTISYCTITGNTADNYGGGIYACGGTISHCTITGNSAQQWWGYGGGVFCEQGVTITDCMISENSAYCGGGVYCDYYSNPNISHCTISENSAEYGGGIYCDYYSNPNITNCTISENSAYYSGGGVYGKWWSDPSITNCTIRGNYVRRGSGAGLAYCDGTISGCTISENLAFRDGGSAYGGGLYDCDGLISNCTITQNQARLGAGLAGCSTVSNCRIVGNGIWYDSAPDPYTGGGVYDCETVRNCLITGNAARDAGGVFSVAQLINCTVARNSASDGTGVYTGWASTNIDNAIIWYDSIADPYTQTTVSYSDVEDGWSGEGNIDSDPLFLEPLTGTWTVDAFYDADSGQTFLIDLFAGWVDGELVGLIVNPDISQTTQFVIAENTAISVAVWGDATFALGANAYEIYDYYFDPNSPCIDTGDPNFVPQPDETDLAGLPRVQGGVVDMGAHEYETDCNGNGVPDWLELPAYVEAADSCADAWAVCPGSTYTGTTTGATNDGSATCGDSASSPDVWYKYTPAESGVATVSLCGSSYDTVLSVHTGCPGTVDNELACDDDACGLQSELSFDATIGVTYLIRIAGYAGVTGDFELLLAGPDCVGGYAADCNENGIPDECDIVDCDPNDPACQDCDANSVPDGCDIADCDPNDPACADCNGNGVPDGCDIAQCDPNDPTCADCNGNGIPDECDITPIFDLAPPTDYAVYNASDIAAGDFDENDYPDIAVAQAWYGAVLVLLNNGVAEGDWLGFDPNGYDYPTGGYAQGLTTADFDSDGHLDLAVSDTEENNVSVLLNMGQDSGNWLGFADPNDFPVGEYPRALTAGDLDNDGYPELAFADGYENTVSVLPNNGTDAGSWLGFGTSIDYAVGDDSSLDSVAMAYLDADGYLDLAVAKWSGEVWVLLNKGTGILKPPIDYDVAYYPYYLKAMTVEDLDDDGAPELIVALYDEWYGGGLVSIWTNVGDGTFVWGNDYPVGASPASVAVGDLDGDGTPDVATANEDGYSVSVLLNNGDGTFADSVEYSVAGHTPSSLAVSDLDVDSRLDMITGSWDGSLLVLLNETASASEDVNCTGVPDDCECWGDLDDNGIVNLNDLTQLLGHYGMTSGAVYTDGDFNCDGDVDLSDLTELLGEYGTICP